MPRITYQPADSEVFNRMLSENGTYMVVVHNRHVVKCEKTVALDAIATTREQYEATYPESAATHPEEVEQAEQLAEELMKRLVFEEPGVTWQSFPDDNKHKDFPGCFRCHDGNHVTEDGESIRL